VPLKLVTGPANAAKAGAVLGPLRDRLDEQPILVVPAFEDTEHAQRELASGRSAARSPIARAPDRGSLRRATFGVSVVRFDALFTLIARRAGLRARRASDLQRHLIVERAAAEARLEMLAASAERPGFARAAVRLMAELGRSRPRLDPAKLTWALRRWAGAGPRRPYADELARLYRGYRAGLEAAGLLDAALFGGQALDALVRAPERWGGTPVFVYGFDDFDGLELDALETLACVVGADVTVSLPDEPGRRALKATSTTREQLKQLAGEVVELEALDDHYAPASRAALHALERGLFEDDPATAPSGGAVVLHRAGGERAEIELCGARVLELLRAGTSPGEVAVVVRDPARCASMLEQVFAAYGIPYSIDRSVPFAHTGVGRGLLACLRCAGPTGAVEDLLAYLRTPGLLREPRLADRLESEARQGGLRSAAEARALWEATPGRWPLAALDRLARARGTQGLVEELNRLLERLFSAPHQRAAHVLHGAELDEARAYRAAHDALTELAALARTGVVLDAPRVHDVLAELPVRAGEAPQPDRVQVASPLAIRARRFTAVLVLGLQAGELPRAGRAEPFLPDGDRRAINAAGELGLPLREDELDRERYLFYVCASRAERLLVLSTRTSDEEGDPEVPSPFLDDVRAVIGDLDEHVRSRSLADVTWPLDQAPTAAEWERALAAQGARRAVDEVGPLSAPAARAELAARDVVSASALEHYADCPVKWLVEDVLRPEKLEPDPEQMARGAYAHRVLELTLSGLRALTGSARVTPASLPEAERLMLAALESERGAFQLSPDRTRVRAAVRRLELDLLRFLRHEAISDTSFEPEHLELRFGFEGSEHPAVELAEGLRVRGVIDRVDTWGGWALVRDYKGGRVGSYKASDWARENRFQAALYMLVTQRALGLRAAGGVYVPLGGGDRRPRGAVSAELTAELGRDFVDNDRLAPEQLEALVGEAERSIAAIAAGMRAGRLAACPGSCAYRGGCSYPSICRVEA
jgi:ATP-dependent helicase/DNAse subunit B